MIITFQHALFLAGCMMTLTFALPAPSPFLGLPSPFKLLGLSSSGRSDSDNDNDGSPSSIFPAIPALPPLVNINNNGDETHQSGHVNHPDPPPSQSLVQNFYHKEINNNDILLSSSSRSSSNSNSNDRYVERPNYSYYPRPEPVNHRHYHGGRRLATFENAYQGQRERIYRFKTDEDCDDLCNGNGYTNGGKQGKKVLRVSMNAH